MVINKRNKQNAGMTLAEILIALLILMLVTGAVLGVFVAGTRISAASKKMTIAIYTAQLQMEELVGLTREEIKTKAEAKDEDGNTKRASFNDYWTEIIVSDDPVKIGEGVNAVSYDNLIKVTVSVYSQDSGGTSICTQENFINVKEGGIG